MNQEALKEEVNRLKVRIFERLDKNAGGLMGSRLDIVEIDDRGENPPVFRFLFPSVKGRAKIKLKIAAAEFNQKMETYIASMGKLKKKYKRSLYLEAITRSFHEYDEIHIVGDLALVDQERNFERGKFKEPIDLTPLAKKKRVELIRVPIPKQDYQTATKIDQWWSRSIFGTDEPPAQTFLF